VIGFAKSFLKKYLPRKVLKKAVPLYAEIKYALNGGEYKGANVYCSCCDKSFGRFKTLDIDPLNHNYDFFKYTRLDVICPYCGSWSRHRVLADYLEKHINTMDSKMLIFAIPRAYITYFQRNKQKYLSADYYNRMADVKADIQELPYRDNEFDFISCDHVLEHVPDDTKALSELRRIVKPGGVVAISVPIMSCLKKTYEDGSVVSPEDRWREFGQADHLRVYGMDFIDKLHAVGFNVEIIDGFTLDERIVPTMAASEDDYNKLFICKK